MSEIIPTIVPKRAADVVQFAQRYAGQAPVLHLDITDGDFAFPTTWMPERGDTLPAGTYVWEAHLMSQTPRETGERLIAAGAWRIIGHAEALVGEEGVHTLRGWRAMGAKEVGIALKLGTSLSTAEHLVAHADVLHLMSIGKIGAQGQSFDEAIIPKIREARERFPHLVISVDGGLDETAIPLVLRAGASRLCVGAALARAGDPIVALHALESLAKNALQ